MKRPVAQYLHHTDTIVNSKEFDEDRNQRQCQQPIDGPSQETICSFSSSTFSQKQMTDTLNQKHVPCPKIDEV